MDCKHTENAPRVQVGRQELAVAFHRRLGGQTAHVGACHELLQKFAQRLGLGVNVDLVLPLKLGPHGPELCFGALRRLDVVHDINVDIVENDHVGVHSLFTTQPLAAGSRTCYAPTYPS